MPSILIDQAQSQQPILNIDKIYAQISAEVHVLTSHNKSQSKTTKKDKRVAE